MFPKPRADLSPNTADVERLPLFKPTGFREYDACWLFPEKINLMELQAIGMGLATLFAERNVPKRFVVDHDFRWHSASVKQALINGLLAGGGSARHRARAFADGLFRSVRIRSRWRRHGGKAEQTNGAANPRFIVTNVDPAFWPARFLYETVYCARGEMENCLKECQGDLFADRTPTPTMRANQLRLWLSSLAYVLMRAVRRIGLVGTRLVVATCDTIRLKLMKLSACVTISVSRVQLAFASSSPDEAAFATASRRLCA
jgi:hypothetical protein